MNLLELKVEYWNWLMADVILDKRAAEIRLVSIKAYSDGTSGSPQSPPFEAKKAECECDVRVSA
jgi:hypothetical protein